MADLELHCSCGRVRGRVRGLSSRTANRLTCYCDDCQAFALFLERGDDVLDAHGGTEIVQTSPARLELREGLDRLACVRLAKGGLMRWYAACCNTPIANTAASSSMPFVGLIHAALDGSLDSAVGPSRGGVWGRFARGDRSTLEAADRASFGVIWNFLSIALLARLRGDQRRSPFFDPASGAPVVKPRVLTPEERRRYSAESSR